MVKTTAYREPADHSDDSANPTIDSQETIVAIGRQRFKSQGTERQQIVERFKLYAGLEDGKFAAVLLSWQEERAPLPTYISDRSLAWLRRNIENAAESSKLPKDLAPFLRAWKEGKGASAK